MKIVILALIFPFLAIYSQKNSDAQKLILKKAKVIKRNFGKEHTQEYREAYQFLIDNFLNSTINYSDLNTYTSTVNLVNKKLDKPTYLSNGGIFIQGNKIQETKVKNLEEYQSQGFYNLFFNQFSKIDNDSIQKMSKYWKDFRKLIADNYWIDKNSNVLIYYDSIFPRILPYYFNKLRLSTNKQKQDSIVFECLNFFPEINTFYGNKYDFLSVIIGDRYLESSWPNGEIKLYNFSYLHDYLEQAGEIDQLKKLGDWVEPSKGIYNPYSDITYEKIKFKNGKFIDTLTSYKNELKYSEIIFSSDKNNLGRIKQINCFDKLGVVVRTRLFEYSSETKNSYSNTYEYHFINGKNIDLENLDNNIRTIENLLANYNCDEALKKINDCKNNFPSNLNQNIKLNELFLKAIQVQNSKQQIDSDITKSKKLIAEKKYSEALEILNTTKNLINKNFNTDFEQYNIVLIQISEVQNLLSLQEKEKLEVNSKIENGKKYLAANNYDLALKTFQDARKNNLSSDYSLNADLDNLIKTTQESQLKEIERRELLKLDNAINEGNRLVTLKKYNEAIQLYENARKNNFKNDLNQNKTLDLKISETRDLIKEDLKRKLYENFDRDLDFTKIGKVEISREYLKVNQFTNGDKLDFASTAEEFVYKTLNQIPTYCFYNFDSKFESKGYYYNIFALNDLDGRQLFTDDYRLPFASEIDYMNKVVNSLESKKDYNKRLELKNYLFKSNTDLAYNGMNIVNYERNTFNCEVENEKIKNNYDGYGQNGFIDNIDDLAHMFWILSDFKFNYNSEIEFNDEFLNTNFKRKNYFNYERNLIENPIKFTIAKFLRKNEYYSDRKIQTTTEIDIESVIPRCGHGKDYYLWAAQVKLIKQRKEILKSDWSSLSTSTLLKYKYENGYGKDKFETNSIIISKNTTEWLNNCNNKIPTCASYNFDSSNDGKFGKVYNKYVFSNDWKNGSNYPNQSNTKLFELIDLCNLRYSFDGSGEEFYEFLFETHSLKFGGNCEYDDKKKELMWYDNIDVNNFRQYNSFFGFIPVIYQDNYYSSKNLLYLKLSKYIDKYDKFKFEAEFEKINDGIYNNFSGYSVRFLKN